MIQSYKKPLQLEEQYDAIIIGTGMGSLTTAAFLAKEGKKVLLLERHYTAGGFTHIFKRKGYEWDVGIHYIGEVQKENSALRKCSITSPTKTCIGPIWGRYMIRSLSETSTMTL